MKKKLCHVFFDEFPKDPRIRRYTNTLLKEGFEVFIISLNDGNSNFFQKKKNLNIYRIPIKKKRGTFLSRFWEYLLFQFFATILVSYVFLRHGVMIYHNHTLPDFLVFSCILPKLFGAKIILDFHELFAEFMMQHKPNLTYSSLLIKTILLQEKLSFGFASEVIVFHEPAKEILEKRVGYKRRITIVMNGVDELELPNFNKIYVDEFRLIYNGTINFNLNLTLVIRALNLIRKKDISLYNNMGFYLYGDGPDLENILNKAKELNVDNVHYKGRLKFQEMVKELEIASACVLPPQKDIYSDLYYSIKLTEMIYFRIPVIATRLKTYLHYYPENCLIYFDSNNAEELAEKIIFTYKNRTAVNIFTVNAYHEYQKINWKIMSDRYLNVISSFL